jgi:hypothetical protein
MLSNRWVGGASHHQILGHQRIARWRLLPRATIGLKIDTVQTFVVSVSFRRFLRLAILLDSAQYQRNRVRKLYFQSIPKLLFPLKRPPSSRETENRTRYGPDIVRLISDIAYQHSNQLVTKNV